MSPHRKSAAAAQQADLMQVTVQCAGEAIIITDADLDFPGPRIIFANPAFEKMSGYSSSELMGKTPRILQGRLSDRKILRQLKDHLRRGESFVGKTTNYRKNGETVLVEFHITPVRDESGKVTHFVGVHRDITAQHTMERALRQSEEQFRVFMDNNPAIAWITDPQDEHRVVYVNQTCFRVLGGEASDYEGQRLQDIVPPDMLEKYISHNQQVLKENRAVEFEEEIRRKDGSMGTFLTLRFPIASTAGKVLVGGTAIDITDRKKSEKIQRDSAELYALTMQGTSVGLWDWDVRANRITFGAQLKKILGYEPEEFPDDIDAYRSAIHPDDRAKALEVIEAHMAGSIPFYDTEYRIRTKSGAYIWVHSRGQGIRDESGKVIRMAGAVHEITAHKTAEEMLRIRERQQTAVAELGKLSLEGMDRESIFQKAVELLSEALTAPVCAIFELNPEDNRLHMAAGLGWEATAPKSISINSKSTNFAGFALKDQQTVASEDFTAEERFKVHEILLENRLKSGAMIVVQGLEGRFGVLGLFWREKRKLTSEEIVFAESIANVLGASIHRYESDSRIRRHLGQLDALRTIDIAIMGSLDLRVTLSVLLDQVLTQLGAHAASVLLLDGGRQLTYGSGKGFQYPNIKKTRLPVTQSIAGMAITMRKAHVVDDLRRPDCPFKRKEMVRAEHFVSYAVAPLIAKGEPQGVLEVYYRKPFVPSREWMDFFESLAGQTAIAINNSRLFDALQRVNVDLTLAYDATLEGWSHALDLRDKETEGHTMRVTEGTETMARALEIPEEQIVHIRRGALLHDIGKMGIPDAILHKPGPLTAEEWVIMKKHPTYAFELLSPIPYLAPALDIPYCHHEKWDGTGYPRGLKEREIPLAARIFAPIDIWDALRSDRPYRKGWPADKVREHIQSLSGSHLDPQAVEVFMKCGFA